MLSISYLDVSDIATDVALNYVSKERADKIKRLKNKNSKKESAGAELLLLSMFAALFPHEPFPPKICQKRYQKPYFEDYKNLYFNLSHSNMCAACVISDKPVGIDIQYMKDFDEKLSQRFFTLDEQNFYKNAHNKKAAFYEIWTKKEALLKCLGTGLGEISSKSIFDAQKEGYVFKIEVFDNFTMCVCQKE